jgi:predicted amidohydrolase YtcJ
MVVPGLHDTHNHFTEVARGYAGTGNPYRPWEPGWDPVEGTVAQQVTAAGHVQTWAEANAARVQDGQLPAPPHASHAHDGHAEPAGRMAANDLYFGGPDHVNQDDAASDLLRLGLRTAAEYGLTSSVEAGLSRGGMTLLKSLDARGEMTLRINAYVFPEDLDATLASQTTTGSGTDNVRVLGVKIYSDGWLGPRTAALRDMYSDRPHQGFAFFTQAEVDDIVLRSHQGGLKLTAHTIGDRATEMLLTAYERALAEGCPDDVNHTVCTDPRFTLEHVQLVQPDLMQRMVDVALVPSIQFSFATSDAPWVESALGAERVRYSYPWRTMVDEGLVVGGSSDFPIEVLHPLWGVERVVTRVDLDGQPSGGFMTEQAVDLDTALRMITINAAYLEFREHELGSLTPGKLADVVVLEKNLFDVPPDTIADTMVHATIVDGRPVYATADLADKLAVSSA